ncbi:MAG: hypothetical protein HY928_09535 [Elusimicrobia bacterium]|nr:hypothetical protein [Elusimicrobiota bacterium]
MTRAVLLCALLASAARAGGLQGFERALDKPAEKAAPAQGTSAVSWGSSNGCGDGWTCLFLNLAAEMGSLTLDYSGKREPGRPELPVARLDLAYQRVFSNIDALSGRAELGWGPLGAAYERIAFREHDPVDRMSGWRAEGLYRIAAGPGFRLDGAAGFMGFRRSEPHDGASTGLSLGVYPRAAWGLEADLRWGAIGDATVSDLRGRLLYSPRSWKGFALRPGYRAIRTGDATLHGPELCIGWTW